MTDQSTAGKTKIGTFLIFPNAAGEFIAADACTFNNWGACAFDSEDDAETYAAGAHAFKTGRRSTCDGLPVGRSIASN